MKKVAKIEPFPPTVTLEQILAYEHGKPETYTSLPLINAVCEKMFQKDVMMPDYVARQLGFERIKLTYAMEVLTGYSLADIRLEMIVKRLREYREAHPDYTELDLARVAGYDNYNAYWRFLDRHKKQFPELRGEESDIQVHVMSVMEPLMEKETVVTRRLYSMLPYRGGRDEAAECAKLLYEHACKVADFAQKVLDRHPGHRFVGCPDLRQCCMLHNVGIVWSEKSEIHCHGKEPYSRHNTFGLTWLCKHQQQSAAIASSACALTSPVGWDFASLVAYASCHYSIFNPQHCKTTDEIRSELSDDASALAQFNRLHQLFG